MEKNSKENNNEPLVSVLTPVYNGDKFLEECINSVLEQSYDNWEYVIVNNCSTDRSLEIAEKYAEIDSRIRIHNNDEFLPQMENLNHAFRQISNESIYCKVVHADDWIYPECISKMVEVAEEYPSVGIVGAYRLVNNKVDLDGLPYSRIFFKGEEIARKHLLRKNLPVFGSPTSLLLRSDLIFEREKFYDESLYASDAAVCLELLKNNNFGFVHQVLTFTRLHKNSITNTKARETYAIIHANLYRQLEYGPYFLSEEEEKNSFSKQIKLFYKVLAKNLLKHKSIKEFNKQVNILEKLDLKFDKKRFMGNLIKEFVSQLFKKAGFEIHKYNENSRQYDVSIFP